MVGDAERRRCLAGPPPAGGDGDRTDGAPRRTGSPAAGGRGGGGHGVRLAAAGGGLGRPSVSTRSRNCCRPSPSASWRSFPRRVTGCGGGTRPCATPSSAPCCPPRWSSIARRAAAEFDTASALSDPDGEQQVDLLIRAGEPARAAVILTALAERALGRSALRTAEELLRRAETLGGGLPVRVALVRVFDRAGRSADALELGEPGAVRSGVGRRPGAVPGGGQRRPDGGPVEHARSSTSTCCPASTRLRWRSGRTRCSAPVIRSARSGRRGPCWSSTARRSRRAAHRPVLCWASAWRPPTGAASVAAWREAATLAARHGLAALRVRAVVALALAATEQDAPWRAAGRGARPRDRRRPAGPRGGDRHPDRGRAAPRRRPVGRAGDGATGRVAERGSTAGRPACDGDGGGRGTDRGAR